MSTITVNGVQINVPDIANVTAAEIAKAINATAPTGVSARPTKGGGISIGSMTLDEFKTEVRNMLFPPLWGARLIRYPALGLTSTDWAPAPGVRRDRRSFMGPYWLLCLLSDINHKATGDDGCGHDGPLHCNAHTLRTIAKHRRALSAAYRLDGDDGMWAVWDVIG